MISLKKLLDTDSDESALTLKAIALFLDAIALRAIEYDAAKRSAYQRSIHDLCERIGRTNEFAGLVLLADEAGRLTDEYNRGAEEYLSALNAEKQSALGVMIEGFLKICADSEAAAQNLRFIERELGEASRLQDIRALKKQMAGCLEVLSQETTRQEKNTQGLQQQIGLHNPGGAIYDPVTGLAGAIPAENYVRGCSNSNEQIYVLLLVLKSLDVVNRRYGYAAGDHLMSYYGATVADRLPPTARLFRWHGPSFLAVMPLPDSVNAVNHEAAKIATVPMEYVMEHEERSILLKPTVVWTVLPIRRSSDAIELSAKLDAFVASHDNRVDPNNAQN